MSVLEPSSMPLLLYPEHDQSKTVAASAGMCPAAVLNDTAAKVLLQVEVCVFCTYSSGSFLHQGNLCTHRSEQH